MTKKITTKEIKELEKYIKDKFNLEIYEDIEETPNLFNCEPLEFFQTLEKSLLFIQQNRENPFAIKQHLKTDFPNPTYFLKKLGEALEREINGYGLTHDQRRIQEVGDLYDNSTFKLKEALEIIRKTLLKAERIEPLAEELQNVKNDEDTDEIQKYKGLNRESAFLFFEYLFNYAGVECDNKKKAQVIERLTSYSHKKIVPLFSWFEKEKLNIEDTTEINKKFSKDMNFVRECFEMLYLTEVIKNIDKDLGN